MRKIYEKHKKDNILPTLIVIIALLNIYLYMRLKSFTSVTIFSLINNRDIK
ncbi:hypothetical protein DBR06_SOUSAS50410009 [Sousa chinensis]|uniref:Uncharacterized protein n=1 Tax=Sousa chinensis TaxID=103600 RepID=A0A484GJM9_SOUCH|nr:hypothetical protein DBR06_SOUSAS50410009 [Sousa chinensis]